MLRFLKQYYPVRNVVFVIGEFAVIYASVLLAYFTLNGSAAFIENRLLPLNTLLIAVTCQVCLYYNDLYDLKVTDTFSELSIRLLQALGATAILLAGVYSLFPLMNIGLRVFVVSIGFDILFIVTWRFLYAFVLSRQLFDQRIVLLGSDRFAQDILHEIRNRKDCGYAIGGILLEKREYRNSEDGWDSEVLDSAEIPILGTKETPHFCALIKAMGIRKIIVALNNPEDLPTRELLKCRVDGIEVMEGNSFYEMLTGKLVVDHLKPEWLIFSDGFRKPPLRRIFKRIIDLVLSLIMLLLLLPLILMIAAIIKLDRKEPDPDPRDIWSYFPKMCAKSPAEAGRNVGRRILGVAAERIPDSASMKTAEVWRRFREICATEGVSPAERLAQWMKMEIDRVDGEGETSHPVFFSQERVGKDGRPYMVHKFRSMIPNAERFSGPIWAGEDDKRITRIGNFIRKWRIDELPQLWNVLKGEMSFVGPRPERPVFVDQLEKTIPYYRERLTVKPGLTGWAQVSYGYGASEDDAKEKLNYDLFYIKNMSILFDLVIVLRTVKIVLFGKGR
jgi:lipopolysaccharide/colanic/teichoic acid biosynthesis glycosyltransferase